MADYSAALGPDGLMNPDHPLLQRAQQAIFKQLQAKKLRVEGQLREKQNALTRAKQQREAVGVELYGYQQNLAKLQVALERTQENYQAIAQIRQQAEQDLAQMRDQLGDDESNTKQERAKADHFQKELQRLHGTLKQIEAYNEQMKGEIAVTRRAAYAAEEAVQKLEKDKAAQDFLIDELQENMRSLGQQAALYTAQLESQRRETRAAQETLAQAEADMESVHFEKKQLTAQWKSSLNAIQRRDEALAAIQDAMRAQQQQEISIEMEMQGFKKDIVKEQIRNEQLSSIVRKMEGEADYVSKNMAVMVERQQRLSEQLDKLGRSLEQTEERLKRAAVEAKAASNEQGSVDRVITKVGQEVQALEAEMLKTLSEQTTAEKSSSKTAADITALRQRCHAEELNIAEAQNELAKLQVDILNTEAHNARLVEALALLNGELKDKEAAIGKYESEVRRRTDEIEKKTREVDQLNKKLERMVAAQPEAANTGPLEATIASLQKEIDTKGVEGQGLQRRWIGKQAELVNLQNDNNSMAEALARLKAEHTVLSQKRKRLESQLAQQQGETKALLAAQGRLRTDLSRINALIADNASARAALEESHLALSGQAGRELALMEEEAVRLKSAVEQGGRDKADILADIVEVERQIMLWERKMQLEKEIQGMLDPTVGEGAVQSMRKEIHRMELRQAELQRTQERLMQELERALSKHEIIGMKAQAATARKSSANSVSASEAAVKRALAEMQRSIRDTEREIAETDQRIQQLTAQRDALEQQLAAAGDSCRDMQQQREEMRAYLAEAATSKYQALLATARQQRTAKRYEEIEAGKYKPLVADPSQLDGELVRAAEKQARIVTVLRALQSGAPELGQDVERILCHVVVPVGAC